MNKIIRSELLGKYPEIIHVCATKVFRPLIWPKEREKEIIKERKSFFPALNIPYDRIVFMNQVHGNRVIKVGDKEAGSGQHPDTFLDDIDGTFTQEKNVFLVVHTADCVPILMYDPEKGAVAAIHAGWQGTVKMIAHKAIHQLIKNCHSNPKDIICYLGPAIGACCYSIAKDSSRIDMFQNVFPAETGVVQIEDDKNYLVDLKKANTWLLTQVGVPQKNIEVSDICTYCHKDQLPSHRREGKERRFGILSMIGMM